MMVKLLIGIMTDILFSALLLSVACVLRNEIPDNKAFLCAGLLLGLAVYLRESTLVFTLAIGLAYLAKGGCLYLRQVTIMVSVFLVLLSPWVVRNYCATHRFILLTTKSTELFYYSSIPLTLDLYAPFTNSSYDYGKLREIYSAASSNSPVRDGVRNYISRPRAQLISMLLKTIALLDKPPLTERPLPIKLAVARWLLDLALYGFHVTIILVGILLAFTRANRFPYLPYLLVTQYVQSLFFWSEPRYLVPFYALLIINSLLWYLRGWHAIFPRTRTCSVN